METCRFAFLRIKKMTGGGGLENFYMQTFFLYANNFFVSPSSCKHFIFTCVQFILVFTTSANNLFQSFPTHPPSRQKIMVRPLREKERGERPGA